MILKTGEQQTCPLTFCEEALVDEAGDDVRVFEVVVVVRAKDVGRDRRGKVAPKLFVVCAAMLCPNVSSKALGTELTDERKGLNWL